MTLTVRVSSCLVLRSFRIFRIFSRSFLMLHYSLWRLLFIIGYFRPEMNSKLWGRRSVTGHWLFELTIFKKYSALHCSFYEIFIFNIYYEENGQIYKLINIEGKSSPPIHNTFKIRANQDWSFPDAEKVVKNWNKNNDRNSLSGSDPNRGLK